jgi:feruloyl-CoA synthase
MTRHQSPSLLVEGPQFAPREVRIEKRPDGTLVLQSPIEFETPQWSILDLIPEWAAKAPQRIFLAQRLPDGEWQKISYAELWQRVQSVGQAMIDLGARRGDRLAILSGNSIEHAIVMFAAMSVGVVAAPISPNYSLMPGGLARLQDIGSLLRPSFVFVQDSEIYSGARKIPELASATWIVADQKAGSVSIQSLYVTLPGVGFEQAFRSIDKEAAAKILFTSGSTGFRKA